MNSIYQGVGKLINPLALDARERWFEPNHPDLTT